MHVHDQDSYEEMIFEQAATFEDNEDFARWCETLAGKCAFASFREQILAPTGIDLESAEQLDFERYKVFFKWVIEAQSDYHKDFITYYRNKWPDSFQEWHNDGAADYANES